MEKAFLLALLLIVAAIGIHSVQAMTAYRSYADQHYYQPNARFETPGYENGAEVDNELRNTGAVRGGATVECKYRSGWARWFCIKYGCNPGNPSDWCWMPIFCGSAAYKGICEDYKDCLERMPCMGEC